MKSDVIINEDFGKQGLVVQKPISNNPVLNV